MDDVLIEFEKNMRFEYTSFNQNGRTASWHVVRAAQGRKDEAEIWSAITRLLKSFRPSASDYQT